MAVFPQTQHGFSVVQARRLAGLALLAATLAGAALAQSQVEYVSWTVSQPTESVAPGDRVAITLQGKVAEGWHVYSFDQPANGPLPLRVTLDAGNLATSDGAPTATAPIKYFDPSFKLDTQYYEQPFTVSVPVRVAQGVAPGAQQIPVSVRFQTCNGKTCHPPKTVRLSAPITVRKAG